MDRRTFVKVAGATAGGVASGVPLPAFAGGWRAEFVLRGGLVHDGLGDRPVEADVVVSGDRILAVGPSIRRTGAEDVDVAGMAVSPGFIDIHSHTDIVLLAHPEAQSKIRQGVTTEVAGQDGSCVAPASPDRVARVRDEYGADVDVSTVAGFFAALERRGAAVNLATMVGAGTLRGLVVGSDDRPATDAELARMVELARQALDDGACGLSTGLEYTPGGFADRAELVALAETLHGRGLPYASHMRNEDDELFAAVEEALTIGRLADVPVHISHLKAQGERNWWKAEPVLHTLEAARRAGIDVTYDRYPYIAYSTGLSNLFPLWARDGGTSAFLARLQDDAERPAIELAVRAKIDQLGSWDAVQITSTASADLTWARGRRLGELASERGEEPFALLLRLMIEDGARPGMVGFGMSEENTARILAHPFGMICSDAPARATQGPLSGGSPHPRAFGSFPRVLGHYCRELGTMPLQTAIQKMTSMPAKRLGLQGRGVIAEGAFADIVVFDPATVADRATFERPHAYPVGIPHVIVNGEFVVRNGDHLGSKPGRVLRPTLEQG